MKKKISAFRLTQQKAKHYLSLNTYLGQRRLDLKHQRFLEGKIADGLFHQGCVAVVYRFVDEPVLADGQHICSAVINTGNTVKCALHEWTEEADDPNDAVARVFAQYGGGKTRTRGDVVWFYGVEAGMEEWPRHCVKSCGTALAYLAAGCPSAIQAMDKQKIGEMLEPNRHDCNAVRTLLYRNGAPPSHVRRSPVVAAVIATTRVEPKDAETFWTQVQDGEMLRKSSPAFKLREYLLHTAVRAGRGNGALGIKKTVDNREMYSACINAWNDYRTGKKVNGRAWRYHPDRPIVEPV